MTYTEKELDQFLHGISLSLLSKKSAQHWRYDEETAKEIEWLEALERKVRADKADRKTENSSEFPNNCEVKNYCDDCLYTDTCDDKAFFYACTSKATISKMEQVDEPKTQTETQNSNLTFKKADERCEVCGHYKLTCDLFSEICRYEPQTEREGE